MNHVVDINISHLYMSQVFSSVRLCLCPVVELTPHYTSIHAAPPDPSSLHDDKRTDALIFM